MAEALLVAQGLFCSALIAGDAVAAHEVAEGAAEQGFGPAELLTGLIAPSLNTIGQMWAQGTASIGVEHRATAIAEGVLRQVVVGRRRSVPIGRVLLSGVEGEWHTMPTRIVARVWEALGWDVVALTPSLPVADLSDLAARDPAFLSGVSCSLPANLLSAWQAISALRRSGSWVIVGGRAFDLHPQVAALFGADAHTTDPLRAHEVLLRWSQMSAPSPREGFGLPAWDAVRHVWIDAPRVVEDSLLIADELGDTGFSKDLLRADLGLLTRTCVCAAALEMPEILHDHIRWYRGLLAGGGIDPDVTAVLLSSIDRVLPSRSQPVRDVLDAARRGSTPAQG